MIYTLLLSFLFSTQLLAGDFTLDNITQEQFSDITSEFSSNFVHTAVTPPNSLGDIFGVEIGAIAGITKTPKTNDVAEGIDSDSSLEEVPHAGLMAQVTTPFGFGIESTLIPETETSGSKFKTFTLATKVTLTDHLINIPFMDLAARFHFGASKLSYKTTDEVSSVDVNSEVNFKTSSYGFSLSGGFNLLLLKPYFGVGYVNTNSTLSVDSSTGTIFDSSFTTGKSSTKKHSGSHIFTGIEFDLLFVHFGLEYAKLMDIEKVTTKLSLAF